MRFSPALILLEDFACNRGGDMVSYVAVWREFRQMIRATRIGLRKKTSNIRKKHDERWRRVHYALCAPLSVFLTGL